MNTDWATILAWINSIAALIVVVTRIKIVKKRKPDWWIHFGFALIGLYWCGLYTIVAILPEGFFEPIWFGQTWVRPAFTVTIVWIASSGLYKSGLRFHRIEFPKVKIPKIKLKFPKLKRKVG